VSFCASVQLALPTLTSEGFFVNVSETCIYPRDILLCDISLKVNRGIRKSNPKLDFTLVKELGKNPELWVSSSLFVRVCIINTVMI